MLAAAATEANEAANASVDLPLTLPPSTATRPFLGQVAQKRPLHLGGDVYVLHLRFHHLSLPAQTPSHRQDGLY